MKVIYDDIIYSLQRAGGISLYWSQLETYLKQDMRLLYRNAEKNIFSPSFPDDDIQIFNNKPVFFERYKNIVLPEKQPFIFHSSYYRYCKNKNAVNITTVHDFMHEILIKNIKSILFSVQKKNAIFHSSGVIFVSKNTKNDFEKFFPNYKGLKKVIYHGIVSEYMNLSIPKRNNNVVFIGGRAYYKNFEYAVKIMERLPKLKLQIVGGGKLEKQEFSFLQKTIPNRYEYFSSLSNAELNIKYNEAKFLLYPSLYEGFGFPVVEAQAAGCPVVCCRVSSLPEVAGDTAVYISGNNIDDDLEKISQLDKQSFYDGVVEKGFENCKRFSWEKCAEETHSFYQEVYSKST